MQVLRHILYPEVSSTQARDIRLVPLHQSMFGSQLQQQQQHRRCGSCSNRLQMRR